MLLGEENKALKVLMLASSKATEATIKEYKKLGANGFLLKPTNIDDLRKEARKHHKKQAFSANIYIKDSKCKRSWKKKNVYKNF